MTEQITKTRSRVRSGWVVIVAATVCFATTARPYEFDRISLDRGLSQSSVQVMVQGPKGYLWAGTQFGLDRYDGYRFKGWRPGSGASGLSNGFVQALRFDRDGRLWVGTGDGLNRLDPVTGTVRQYFPAGHDRTRGRFLVNPGSLVEDAAGNILLASSAGPMRWNRARDALEPIDYDGAPGEIPAGQLIRTGPGAIWLVARTKLWHYRAGRDRFEQVLDLPPHRNVANIQGAAAALPDGGLAYPAERALYLLSPSGAVTRRIALDEIDPESSRLEGVALAEDGALWLVTSTRILRAAGPDWADWRPMIDSIPSRDLPANYRQHIDVAMTDDGRTWVAGQFGVGVLEPGADRLRVLQHRPEDPRSLPPTLAEIGYSLMVDRFDVLWIGTNLGGLARLAPQADRFTHVRDERSSNRSRNVVRAITEQRIDGREWVWVSNQGAGISVWQRDLHGAYARVAEYSSAHGNLPEDTIHELVTEPGQQAVWILGKGWIGRVRRPGEPIQRHAVDPMTPRAARFDPDGTLWIGGSYQLMQFAIDDQNRPRALARFDFLDRPDTGHLEVFSICRRQDSSASGDAAPEIMVGGFGGLARVNPATGTIRHYLPGGATRSDPRNLVFHLHCASDGEVWFGTRGAGLGRMRFDARDQPQFEFFGTEQGLSDSTVYALLPGSGRRLWLSSNAGIMRFDTIGGGVEQFGPADGVQGLEFNNTVGHIGTSGRYYFGGIHGWNVFQPESIQAMPEPPIVHALSVRFNDQPWTLARGQPLRLDHDRNRFEIEFVGLHFAAPEEIRYAYRLQGLDRDWIDAAGTHSARYGSLPPGRYRFEARAANPDGVWSAPVELLQFSIARPPWATPLAWAGYALALIAALWLYTRTQRRRRHMLEAVVDERTAQLRQQHRLLERQAHELKDALDARTILFANISHEFRTPLTLIRAAFDRLETGPDPKAIELGHRYVNRVLRLVEQLLDLSRLRMRRLSRSSAPWRMDHLVTQTVEAFEPIARRNGIRLEMSIDGPWMARLPKDIVERIVLNLLANAIKYTPAGGRIHVELNGHGAGVEISVHDSGQGIARPEAERIFERFYRTESAESGPHSGAGIGLALVKEAIDVLGGSIAVDSTPGRGSSFSVQLPAERGRAMDPSPAIELDRQRVQLDLELLDGRPLQPVPAPRPPQSAQRPDGTVLVVEDNDDLRAWLVTVLTDRRWQVVEAGNGREGLEQARRHAPDLIISDLMMPELDGFGMLKQLRADADTSHIPVLLLTARQDDRTRLEAWTLSADAFLGKPFSIDELTARIDQMLSNRRRLRDHLLRTPANGRQPLADPENEPGRPAPGDGPLGLLETGPDRNALVRRDAELLKAVRTWLESRHTDPEADIQAMADAACVTARTLQRKLKALTGRTPAELLREQRLQTARRMLTEGSESITEIAHACGFSSAQYFSRVFRQHHGQPPEAWRRKRA